MQPSWRYVNRVEIPETFADSLHGLQFDGLNVRVEFCVNRFDPPVPPKAPTGEQVTAARIVMPLHGILQLIDALKQLEPAIRAVAAGQQVQMPPQPTPPGKMN